MRMSKINIPDLYWKDGKLKMKKVAIPNVEIEGYASQKDYRESQDENYWAGVYQDADVDREREYEHRQNLK